MMDLQYIPEELLAQFARLRKRPVILEGAGVGEDFVGNDGCEHTVLEDVSFTLHQREFLSIVGPSGCGKSTLIRMVAGLENVSRGTITLENKIVKNPGAERGMVFQKYTLFPWLTVLKNVMFGLLSNGDDYRTAERQALQWLDIVGLEKYAAHYPRQLSGGMQQRVAIARALAPQPRVLLMDEPFGALDAQTRAQMQEYLLEIWRNIDISIIFVTHDLDEAVYLSERILVLQANPGRVNELIDVPLGQPRNPEILRSAPFQATRAHLDALINLRVEHPSGSNFKIINMIFKGKENT
jgi:NitT/TauT family transport system ATP-binding protein